jgi:hypothetical protein
VENDKHSNVIQLRNRSNLWLYRRPSWKAKDLTRMNTIFARLEDDIVDIVSHNNLNRLVVNLWNWLRLPEW